MQQTWLAGGRLYGALDTIANVAGNIKAASAFFVVDPVAKAIARQGYDGVAGNNVNYPAIAVLPNGKGSHGLLPGRRQPLPQRRLRAAERRRQRRHGPRRRQGVGPQDGFSKYVFTTAPAPTRRRPGPGGATTARP
jgi:hypothetical protein